MPEEFIRIETRLGRIVVAYSERRKRIARGRSTKARSVRKALRKLREGERKCDILYKVARVIEEVARKYNARVVIGNVYEGKEKIVERIPGRRLRHRIHQWSVSKLVRILSQKPVYVEDVSEEDTSSRDPFKPSRRLVYTPTVIRVRVSGGFGEKVVVRVVRLSNGWVLDRDMVGALGIGLRVFPDGRPVALASTESHAVRMRLVIPYLGLTQTTELKVFKNI